MNKKITPVTKPHLPDKKKFHRMIDKIYSNQQLTNNGEYLIKLERKLESFLGVKNVICVGNGTLALQLAYKALGLSGEVITTPFSFIATASSLVWENLKPRFCDIRHDTLNIDEEKIKELVNKKTSAIVPVHVFGNPCNVEKINHIAKENRLKVIYDACHCFNSKYKGKSVLNHGDISTLSFHSTKIFHTIEGGAIITNNTKLASSIRQMLNFGLSDKGIKCLGINAKMSEFNAAMGLCNLNEFSKIIKQRRKTWENYRAKLSDKINFQKWQKHSQNNFSYAPIIIESERVLKKIVKNLNNENIYPKRYFYPSLDSVDYLKSSNNCPNSQSISKRILCLPMYFDYDNETQEKTISIINQTIKS